MLPWQIRIALGSGRTARYGAVVIMCVIAFRGGFSVIVTTDLDRVRGQNDLRLGGFW